MLRVTRHSYPDASIRVYGQRDLPAWMRGYARTFPKGFGYWIWKAWIVNEVVENSQDNTAVIYVDARCGIPDVRIPWIDSLAASPMHDIAVWQSHDAEALWTSADLLSALSDEGGISDHRTGQYYATFFGLRINDQTRRMVHDWWHFQRMNLSLVRADSFLIENYPEFREHRWDQSVFSLTVKRHARRGLTVLPIMDDEISEGLSIVPHHSPHPDILYPFTHSMPGRRIKMFLKGITTEYL